GGDRRRQRTRVRCGRTKYGKLARVCGTSHRAVARRVRRPGRYESLPRTPTTTLDREGRENRKMIRKVLIANRGEIAIRIASTLREMDIRTVAVFTEPDKTALHIRSADEARPIGSYLDAQEIVRAAKESDADAIHPGYGFLSENADFSAACEAGG